MKFLKEDFGESEELNTFVYQLYKRFNPFYRVTLKLDGKTSNRFFAYEDAAKEYYDKLVKEANEDKFYYDGADISLITINLNIEEDEEESVLIFDDDDLNERLNKELGLKK